jgi:hypothetical protein
MQFGDDAVDEVVEAARDPREHDVEAVAGAAVELLLHLVGNHLRSADHREATIAAGDLRQLADRQIVAPGAFDDPLATALAGVALRDLGQPAVEVDGRCVAALRSTMRRYRCRGAQGCRARPACCALLIPVIADRRTRRPPMGLIPEN